MLKRDMSAQASWSFFPLLIDLKSFIQQQEARIKAQEERVEKIQGTYTEFLAEKKESEMSLQWNRAREAELRQGLSISKGNLKKLEDAPEEKYHFCHLSKLKAKELAQKEVFYLQEDGTYVVRDPKGVLQTGTIQGIVLSNLEQQFQDPRFQETVLSITAKVGHTAPKREVAMRQTREDIRKFETEIATRKTRIKEYSSDVQALDEEIRERKEELETKTEILNALKSALKKAETTLTRQNESCSSFVGYTRLGSPSSSH